MAWQANVEERTRTTTIKWNPPFNVAMSIVSAAAKRLKMGAHVAACVAMRAVGTGIEGEHGGQERDQDD